MPEITALADYRAFADITESWELVKTGLIVIRDTMYRLELWHSHSNLDLRYYVSVYIRENEVWRHMPDQPFSTGVDGDQTMRSAMAFLSERASE